MNEADPQSVATTKVADGGEFRAREVAERHAPRAQTAPTDCSPFAYTGELVGGRRGALAVVYGALWVRMCQIYLEKPKWNAEGPPCNITAQAGFGYFFAKKYL